MQLIVDISNIRYLKLIGTSNQLPGPLANHQGLGFKQSRAQASNYASRTKKVLGIRGMFGRLGILWNIMEYLEYMEFLEYSWNKSKASMFQCTNVQSQSV